MEGSPPRKARSQVVNVLDEDEDLAQDLSAAALEGARRDAVARLVLIETGDWFPPGGIPADIGGLGLLVIEGVIVRSVSVVDRRGVELFGPGDLVRPFDPPSDARVVVPAEVGWWALISARLAILDARFTRRICGYPELVDRLMGRLERRSATHALRLTISQQPRLYTRVHLLLWHLADRFGEGDAEGVLIPLPLSHEMLAQLVGAQRPSVSRALKALERADLVARRSTGSWLLRGQPPFGGGR